MKKLQILGLNALGVQKPHLLRTIQAAEGNPACFATGKTECDQLLCCWREDCMPNEKQVLR